MRVAVASAFVFLVAPAASAHDGYTNWVNRQDKGCCNDRDCRPISDADVRDTKDHVEVRIGDSWCPVQSWQYLKSGNAPDWSTAHVCIRSYNMADDGAPRSPFGTSSFSPCVRLLCFQPKPRF